MKNRDTMDRRDFLKKLSLTGIGGGIFLHLLGPKALAQFPYTEREDSILLESGGPLKPSPLHRIGKGIKNEYPRVAVTGDGRIWVTDVSERKQGEGVFLREFLESGGFGPEIPVSDQTGFEYQPQIIADGDDACVIWTAKRGGGPQILLRRFKNGKPGPEIVLSSPGIVIGKPCLTLEKPGILWAAWEAKHKDRFHIMTRRVEGGIPGETITVTSGDKDNRRPALCTDSSGNVWIAWDRHEGQGNLNIYMKNLSRADKGEIRVTHHPASDLAPSIAADPEGYVWIAWHSNRRGEDGWDIPRWFQLRAYRDGQFYQTVSPPPDMDLTKDGTVQSLEFIKVACGRDGRIVVTGRPSHNFCIQWYKGGRWSRLHRFPEDGWGGRGQYAPAVQDQKGRFLVPRRDLGMNVLQAIGGLDGAYEKPQIKRRHAPLESPALVGFEKKFNFPDWNGYNFYYGDIHAHSWMSDGTGDVDEFYIQHREFLRDDFAVLTDHDTFVGNGMIPSEWEEQKEIAGHFNDPGRFITMYGQEWTTARWPKQFGHKNIYHIDPKMPLLDHTDEKSDHTDKIFKQARELGAICIPHHIGWTGVDWENHDPVAQPLVEIVSGHGAFEYMGNRPIYHRGGKPGCFVQDGLARGLKFGIVGGSDTHGLIWHHRVGWKRNCLRTGLTCLLAKDLTREALFEAMKKRRAFATSGIKMRILFEISDAMMGEEIELSEKPEIRVNVTSPKDMKWIELVKNNKTIYSYGGEGYQSRFTYVDEKASPGESYYYLRVITEDGNMGWSSPIWVTYNPA